MQIFIRGTYSTPVLCTDSTAVRHITPSDTVADHQPGPHVINMHRVAFCETEKHANFRKSNIFGRRNGIWQIGRTDLEDVQKNLPEDKKAALIQKFGVDVDEVIHDHDDLLDVRTGAAVARALVYRKPAKIPEDDDGQAAYWVGP